MLAPCTQASCEREKGGPGGAHVIRCGLIHFIYRSISFTDGGKVGNINAPMIGRKADLGARVSSGVI